MQKLIKNGSLADNPWLQVASDSTPEQLEGIAAEHLLLPLPLWQSQRQQLMAAGRQVGVWLDSHETPDDLADTLSEASLVALNFPAFMDGRPYTTATCLRQQHAYTGELRAVGDVLRDQLYYMKRCGFDSFDLHESVDPADALTAFADFSTSYMSTIEEPAPLFRRRA